MFPVSNASQTNLNAQLLMNNESQMIDGSDINTSVDFPVIALEKAQERIYEYFLDLVNNVSPEQSLMEFKYLFFELQSNHINTRPLESLTKIILSDQKSVFLDTLKRTCFILINNWETSRHFPYIQELINSFSRLNFGLESSGLFQRLRIWLKFFVEGSDYSNLKLFATKYDKSENIHWSQRYTSYLLVDQYTDPNSSTEQKKAAKALSEDLKKQFKFDLAMYTARSQSEVNREDTVKNPTNLGEDGLKLIKKVIAKHGFFNYSNIANIFLKQVDGIYYDDFKEALKSYLVFAIANPSLKSLLERKFANKLNNLYVEEHEEVLNDSLFLRTCHRIIEYLTTEDGQNPSELFISIMSYGDPLNSVLFLLKVILICPKCRMFLDARIAMLIKYYMNYSEEECHWVVRFFEIFNITVAIHADRDVQYDLIKVEDDVKDLSPEGLDSYRIFSLENKKIQDKLKKSAVQFNQEM